MVTTRISNTDLSERVRQFVLRDIDSIEQLEVLLLLRQTSDQFWKIQTISDHLRSTPVSVERRLQSLEKLNLIEKSENTFRYRPSTKEKADVIDELSELYKTRRQTIFELIFSPLKKIRNFAEAFVVTNNQDEGD